MHKKINIYVLYDKALDNVKSKPAGYTIAIMIIIFSAVMLPFIPENVRIWAYFGCMLLLSFLLFLLLRPKTNQIEEITNLNELISFGFFTDYLHLFPKLIEENDQITLHFIHSRRWRENYYNLIEDFVKKQGNLVVFLPNPENPNLMKAIKDHFDDGDHIPNLILDAYRHFLFLKNINEENVTVRMYETYPAYSFYKFNDSILVALYPNTERRKDVPAFFAPKASKTWTFVTDDIKMFEQKSDSLSKLQIQNLIKK